MKKVRPFNILLIMILVISASSTCKKSPEEKKREMYISSPIGLELRNNPDNNSQILYNIPFAEKIQIFEEKNEEIFVSNRYGKWCNVTWGDKKGWVFNAFLSDFNPNNIIPIAVNYYTKYFNDNKEKFCLDAAGMKDFSPIKPNDILIKNVINNFILLEVPQVADCGEPGKGNVIWIYKKEDNTFKELFSNEGRMQSIKMVYLDKDKQPDLITESGCCGSWDIKIYLHKNDEGFKLDKEIECGEVNEAKGIDEPLCEEKNIYELYKK